MQAKQTPRALTRTQTYLTQAQQKRLVLACRGTAVTKSELIRRAGDQFLDQQPSATPAAKTQRLGSIAGLWADRADMADPASYVRAVRTPPLLMAASLLTEVLVDSAVLIWTLRGNTKALAHMQGPADWHISALSYMELAQGLRNKTELRAIQKAFKSANIDVRLITTAISDLACQLAQAHALPNSLYMADALIAATAIGHRPSAIRCRC